MKALLRRIRQILRDRKTRRIFTRFVSTVAAIVVFVTTYALVLPAITLESQASCGQEAHQHSAECFEEVLVCDIPESPGHHHDESCYAASPVLTCELEEHIHSVDNGCYDENGDLICEKAVHEHGADCFEEVRELVCGMVESEGHQHSDPCYTKILTCGLEPHTHSAECYRGDGDGSMADAAAVASTESSAAAALAGSAVSTKPAVSTGSAAQAGSAAAADASRSAADDAGEAVSAEDAGNAASMAVADGSGYVPVLEPLDLCTLLTRRTGIYYSRSAPVDGGNTGVGNERAAVEDLTVVGSESAAVEDDAAVDNDEATEDPGTTWNRIGSSTELGRDDLLRVYLSYTI